MSNEEEFALSKLLLLKIQLEKLTGLLLYNFDVDQLQIYIAKIS